MIENLEKLKSRKSGVDRPVRKVKKAEIDEGQQMYLDVMKIFHGRDFKQERSNIREQVDALE